MKALCNSILPSVYYFCVAPFTSPVSYQALEYQQDINKLIISCVKIVDYVCLCPPKQAQRNSILPYFCSK